MLPAISPIECFLRLGDDKRLRSSFNLTIRIYSAGLISNLSLNKYSSLRRETPTPCARFLESTLIPLWERIKNLARLSNRSFCSIGIHQGKVIQSRSEKSILKEAEFIIKQKSFKGHITDVGGPTANMYNAFCKKGSCDSRQCIRNSGICENLKLDHKKYLKILGKIKMFVLGGLLSRKILTDSDCQYYSFYSLDYPYDHFENYHHSLLKNDFTSQSFLNKTDHFYSKNEY